LECYTIRLPARAFRRGTGGESSALSTPRVRLPPQRRVCRAPPQERARRRRETREQGCHGQNPLGVGPCFTRALSRAATRNADHALPGVTARMGGSDFHASPPASSLLHLFAGARFLRTDAWISLVTAYSQCQARHGLGPRGVSLPLAVARHGLLPTGGTKPSALTNQNFRGSTPSGPASPVTLCTSPAFAPTNRRACYQSRRKARYWARGSRLPRRDSHPLEHATLPGRTVPGFTLVCPAPG
jgi:hypothetical protein